MKREKILWVPVGLAALVAACSGKGDITPPPPQTGGLTQDNAVQVLREIDGGNIPLRPIPPGLMVGFVTGQGKQPLQGCAGTWRGDTTDSDGDGIPVNASMEVDCDTTITDSMMSMRQVMRGRVQGTDSDDADPWVGRVNFSGLGGTGEFLMRMESSGSYSSMMETRIAGYVEATHQGGTFGQNVDMSMDMSRAEGGIADTFSMDYRGSLAFTPTDPAWTPGLSDSYDGELTLNASWTLENIGIVDASTPTPLQLSASCGGDPMSGTLQISDGANTLEITWTGCGQYTATLNGEALPPAF